MRDGVKILHRSKNTFVLHVPASGHVGQKTALYFENEEELTMLFENKGVRLLKSIWPCR